MKLICDRERLLSAFQLAANVAPSRSPKPILENVKLEAADQTITLTATDLEIGIRTEVPGIEIGAPGAVVLPVKRVGPILRESSDEKLTLESDGSKLRIRGDRSEFNLPTQNPDEFPVVSSFSEEKYHKLPARAFRELVRRTAFATETESSRYALGGVLMEMNPNEIIGVGTDGRRLARQQSPAEAVGGHRTADTTVVPTRALQLMERAVPDADDEIHLAARENDCLLRTGQTTIYSRLVEGRYPKWRDVFPKTEQMGRVELVVGPFHAAVRQSAVVTSEERRGVDFQFSEGRVVLAGHGAEYGESHIELPIAYEGPEIPVKLDPRYVSEFLRVLDPDKAFTLFIRDPESAVLCTTDDGYAYVIMPLSRET